ncbi:MAG: hypothetical protein ACJAUR_001528 [Ulvibacter sp.]|jgi:hypothetical protein
MKLNVFKIVLFLCTAFSAIAQDSQNIIDGTITFITSNNVYVKFSDTEKITIGSTLYFQNNPCLKVTQKSSTSVVCTLINDCQIKKDDTIKYTYNETIEVEPEEVIDDNLDESIPTEIQDTTTNYPKETSIYSERIRGRISAASYNNFSNLRENRHRLQTRFSLTANHINDGKFSIESYVTYRNNISVPENYRGRTSIFNVYNLNATYDATESLSINLGRRINPKASTFGANDGLQIEKYFGAFYVGAVVGFRPDFFDYSRNTDLLQYGGYAGIDTKTEDFYSSTTLGAMEQTNNGATDRRYVFFQHNSTIASNLNLFSSAELDIFSPSDSISSSGSRLTNLYISARYRFGRVANAMVSYDSRKQIIYYETFQSEIERLLDDDLARQGIRLRLNVRPTKIVWIGASYSNRTQSDNQNASDNIYGYATLTKIPKLGGRLNVSYNINSTRYLNSKILSVRHNRELVENKLNADFYFRMADYDFENQDTAYKQNYFGVGLGWRISGTWQFNFSGEYSTINDENNMRFYTQINKLLLFKKEKIK